MSNREIMVLDATLCVREGISKKTGNPYSIPFISIETPYGVIEVNLDTRNDRAGIILDMIARKEG